MLSIVNTKLGEELEWRRLKLRAMVKISLSKREKGEGEREGKREREGIEQIKSRLCKRGLISLHTHTWSWWSHAPNT